jgi:hypothetical protein
MKMNIVLVRNFTCCSYVMRKIFPHSFFPLPIPALIEIQPSVIGKRRKSSRKRKKIVCSFPQEPWPYGRPTTYEEIQVLTWGYTHQNDKLLGSIENFVVYLFLPWLRDEDIPFSPLDLPDDLCLKKYLNYKFKDRLLYFCDELLGMEHPYTWDEPPSWKRISFNQTTHWSRRKIREILSPLAEHSPLRELSSDEFIW